VLHQAIEQRLRAALAQVVPDADLAAVSVRPCAESRFGDYQTSAVMALAKQRRANPRQLATAVLAQLDVAEWCEPPEIAGAGFINFRLKPSAVFRCLEEAARGEHLFFRRAAVPRTIVLDFSSPNVAKAMHVGHIRSTILGDCLARVFRLLGHRVITDNHLGDWGTQFGMLLVGWKTQLDPAALQADPIAELERVYREVNARCDPQLPGFDPATLERARAELVKLQRGDAENLAIWRQMIALSRRQFDAIYARLGVKFDHTLGESFYQPRLQATVEELRRLGIARESEGAIVIFFDDVPELKATPALIQKSDGAFNYMTTDLATLAYRLETWQPDEIIYVTDARQQLHFKQLFAAFRRWWAVRQTQGQPPECAAERPPSDAAPRTPLPALPKLVHVWFGSILGEDKTPLKTRSGGTIKLADLLDEAEERAFAVVSQKNPDLPETQRRDIARVVGLGAIKYADLLPNRQSDYVFSWDKLLSLTGNTAPYLQYAYTRIRSIFRKATSGRPDDSESPLTPQPSPSQGALQHPAELALAKHLLNFGLVLETVAEDCRPNFLCNYLYELAGLFTAFYENCPVLKADPMARATRLLLCDLTARVLRQGLEALGIETTEQM
jgi:arginyl-tRNA synthetase